ncbi:hypothetical protein DVH24_019340 [Malus domestica]|uniref:Uncharacterized protein n=1 Tax=Malus domestica TaxID=3750 RepID=A0A498I2I3_MALDO|nr:hypothetical protein DVH24_019340 [Malus domestica]
MLIGQKKIFHLQFGNKTNAFNSNDILIHNMIEDTTMQPATPQPLSREITMSSTTVSSSTSMGINQASSFHRRGVEQISDMDPREFDEVPIKLLKNKSSPTAGKPDGTPPKKKT